MQFLIFNRYQNEYRLLLTKLFQCILVIVFPYSKLGIVQKNLMTPTIQLKAPSQENRNLRNIPNFQLTVETGL